MESTKYETLATLYKRSKHLLDQQEKQSAYVSDYDKLIKELVEAKTKEEISDAEFENRLKERISSMLRSANILMDETLEIDQVGLLVFGFIQRPELTYDHVLACWQKEELYLFEEVPDRWAIGINNPPKIGNEYVRNYKELNHIYLGKTGFDLLGKNYKY